jgi:hypothetical protein
MMWTLEEARVLVAELQPQAWVLRWNLCIGGGVLNFGSSDNDLDLVAIPTSTEAVNQHVLALFTNSGWEYKVSSNLPCATCHQMTCNEKILELLVMKCGQYSGG